MQDFSITLRCDGTRLNDLGAWLRRFAIKNPGHCGTWFCFYRQSSVCFIKVYPIQLQIPCLNNLANTWHPMLVHDFEDDIGILATVIE